MNQVTVLQDAKQVLVSAGNRSIGNYATDKNGFMVGVRSPEAVCFCSLGAMRRVIGSDVREKYKTCGLAHLSKAMGGNIVRFNDNSTYEEVLAAFDVAIKEAQACQM